MKKYLNLFAAVAVVATSFISCSKESTPLVREQENQKVKISFKAQTVDPSTKTYFGDMGETGYKTVWSVNQDVKMSINCVEGHSEDATVIPSGDGLTASFDVEFQTIPVGTKVFYSISPASAVKKYNSGWEFLEFQVPSEQTPTMTSVDEAAHILGARTDPDAPYEEMPEQVTLKYSHIAAYGKFTLKNMPDGITINSIDITSDEYLTGNYMYPVGGYSGGFEQSKSLTINASKLSAESNSQLVFWFSVLPVDLGGKKVTFTVHTSAGTYTKEVTYPSGKGNFQAGKIRSFVLNMNGADYEPLRYVLVTDLTELTEGSEVIIASTVFNKAMSIEMYSDPWRKEVDITKSSDKTIIENPGENVQVLTLRKGSAYNTVMLECKNGDYAGMYIGSKLTPNPSDLSWEYLFNCTEATSERGISHNINLKDNGDAVIGPFNTQNRYKYMSYSDYNHDFFMGDAYITNYAIAIYKLVGSGEDGEQLILPAPEFHFISGVNNVSGFDYPHLGNTQYLPKTGGTYVVEYEMKYAPSGEQAVQLAGIDYAGLTVSDVDVSELGKITINLPANTSGSLKSGNIYFYYKYNKVNGVWQNEVFQKIYIAQSGI